jgi:hypothetical protein
MIKKVCFLIFSVVFAGQAYGQYFVKTTDLFQRSGENAGRLVIDQNPSIDTLIGRYILMNEKVYEQYGYYGMKGYRIQIYNSSNRNAREESSKARAEFISRFPDIVSYPMYSEPGYFKVRVGDFRTKAEATKLFLAISKVFPDAYIVPDVINFPELNKK